MRDVSLEVIDTRKIQCTQSTQTQYTIFPTHLCQSQTMDKFENFHEKNYLCLFNLLSGQEIIFFADNLESLTEFRTKSPTFEQLKKFFK